MKVRFEIQLSGEATGLQSLRTANGGTITISALTACMGFRTQPRVVSKSRSQTVIRAACCGLHAALSVTGGTRLRGAAGTWVTMSVSGVVARRCRPQLATILCASERLDVATACPKENFDGSRQ